MAFAREKLFLQIAGAIDRGGAHFYSHVREMRRCQTGIGK